jgi:hypothetical protein
MQDIVLETSLVIDYTIKISPQNITNFIVQSFNLFVGTYITAILEEQKSNGEIR